MNFSILVYAYLSPETLLPATSILATIMGVVMMLGSRSARVVRRLLRGVVRRRIRRLVPRPHYAGNQARTTSSCSIAPAHEGADVQRS